MNRSSNVNDVLDTVAAILLWCFGLGVAFLLLWFGLLLLVGDFIYEFHGRWFQISREQFDALHYLGLMLAKVAIFWLFLLPYVGIKMVLRKKSR
jgi:hypothetical protein